MPARFVDYYKVLEVKRDATPEEVQRAYRVLARKYHPDVNKDGDAQKRFQEVQEAYEVLKEPARRKRYDDLGADYKPGQEFRGGAGGQGRRSGSAGGAGGGRGFNADFGGGMGGMGGMGGGNFSDFFESLFGQNADPFGEAGGMHTARTGDRASRGRAGSQRGGGGGPRRGGDAEAELTISLADAANRATKRVTLTDAEGTNRTLDVKVPPGITDGATIRLTGQGGPGREGGVAGDLLLHLRIAPDPRFRVDAADPFTLITTVPIAPWEAALGAKVHVPTIDSEVVLTIPAGTSSGQRLRVRGHGLPRKSGDRADLIAEARIVVPPTIEPEVRALYERLAAESNFDPRAA